jgi:hypothetical protein
MSKIDYPRWIYKGKTEQKIVNDLTEYEAALAAGWRKGVIDEAEIDDSEKIDKIRDDTKFIKKEVKKISTGVDALLNGSGPKSMISEEEPEKSETPEEPLSYRTMLEANAKKLNIKFGIKTSNSQLAAMIQRRG